MADVFAPMGPAERDRFGRAYLEYLRGRDGTPDLAGRCLDLRERLFAGLAEDPVRWHGTPPVDQATFDRNHARRRPEGGLPRATLWALATAKANRGERYGVEYALRHPRRPTASPGAGAAARAPAAAAASDDPHTYVMLEELYHTRILRDALGTLGIAMEVGLPGLSTRALVGAMVRLPESVSSVVVFAGEVVGVAVFTLLLDEARALFAAQPPVLARLEALFAQILVDEVGHVHFVRSRLGPVGLAAARQLLPLVGGGVLDDLPELAQLFGRQRVMATVRAAEVDAAAAGYPDRFVCPG